MNDEAEHEHRCEQISRAFALVTAKLEDAATLAVEGQGALSDEQLLIVSIKITEMASETAIIAGAVAALLSDRID